MDMKTRYHNSQHPARKGGTWGGLMPRTLRVALYLRADLRCEACGYEATSLRGRDCKLSLTTWLKGGGHSKLGLVRSAGATSRILRAQARRSMNRHEKLAAILVRDENRARRARRAA